MFSAILLVAAIGANQQPDLFRTIIGAPTGENGYEEYVMAADMAITAQVRKYFIQVNLETADGTKLDRRRDLARRLGRIETLIQQGNKKPVFYPSPMNFSTSLPEISPLLNLGSALVEKAEVHFADGQVNQGFDTLTTVVEYGHKLSGAGSLIHNLVGRAIALPATRSFAKNIALLSLPAARDLQQRIAALSELPSPLVAAMRSEMQTIVASLPQFLEDPTNFVEDPEVERRMAELRDLPPQRKKAIADELVFAITRHGEARLQMFERPEREWPAISRQIEEMAGPEDPLAKVAYASFVPEYGRVDIIEIARRTQFRLMIVYCEVKQYRWEHGFLPSSLAKLEDQRIAYDPLTNGPFEYERTETAFRIYSRGTDDTGPIDLFYTPPRSAAIKPD